MLPKIISSWKVTCLWSLSKLIIQNAISISWNLSKLTPKLLSTFEWMYDIVIIVFVYKSTSYIGLPNILSGISRRCDQITLKITSNFSDHKSGRKYQRIKPSASQCSRWAGNKLVILFYLEREIFIDFLFEKHFKWCTPKENMRILAFYSAIAMTRSILKWLTWQSNYCLWKVMRTEYIELYSCRLA